MDKRISLWCVNFICLVTPSEIKNYFPNPIPNSIKILLQSKPFSVKQLGLPVSLFGQTNKPCLLTVRVTRATFVSRTSLANCVTSHMCDKFAPVACLSQRYAMSSTCYMHFNSLVFTLSGFWTCDFQEATISTFLVWFIWKLTIWSKYVSVLLCKICEIRVISQYQNYAPSEVFVPFFGPTNIYCDNEHNDLSYTNYVFVLYPFDRQDIILLAIIGKRDIK